MARKKKKKVSKKKKLSSFEKFKDHISNEIKNKNLEHWQDSKPFIEGLMIGLETGVKLSKGEFKNGKR